MKITKEELLEIPRIAGRIQHEREKVDAMKAKLYSPKGLDTSEKVQRSGGSDPILADVVIDAEAELRGEEQELEVMTRRAETLIKARLTGEDKEVMMLRYVKCLQWSMIADTMAYSPQTIFRRHRDALERLFTDERRERWDGDRIVR